MSTRDMTKPQLGIALERQGIDRQGLGWRGIRYAGFILAPGLVFFAFVGLCCFEVSWLIEGIVSWLMAWACWWAMKKLEN